MKIFAAIASALLLVGGAAYGQKTTSRALDRQVEQLVGKMTLEEKALMLVGVWEDDVHTNIISSAGRTHPIERLGIAATTMNDGATGLRMDTLRTGYPDKRYYCTGFPVAIMLASTWNDAVVRDVARAISHEMTEYECDLLLGPSLNIQRNPLCGRNFEYFSEDPCLAGHTAAQFVQGIQKAGTGATVKHFAANSQQSARVNNDARVSKRALREIYLKNFEIAVREGRPFAVMTSLNFINGRRSCADPELLTTLLRDEWGWDGVVMTDWFKPEVTADCVHAGNDLLMGGCREQVDEIIAGVRDGSISIADVDRNVRNVLRYVMKTNSQKGHTGSFAPDLEGDAKVALEAAKEGIVLLKNDSAALPLAPREQVAVFGVGSYLFYANGLGSADINKPYTVNLLQGMDEAGIMMSPVLDEFYRKYFTAEQVQLRETNVNTWKNWFFGFKVPQEAALRPFFVAKRAEDCDKAIITIARNCGEALDRDYVEGEFLLTPTEKEMIGMVADAFHAKGKQVVVVINTGSPIEVGSWKDKADAILLAWQPGQEGGRAVASVLKGETCPSGRLPVSWADDFWDYPSSANFPIHYKFSWDDVKPFGSEALKQTRNLGYTEYEEDIWVGYRYFNTFGKPVAFPFGHGLSYTTFEWTDARVEKRGRATVTVSVNVTNTGACAGKEVVQLYSTQPEWKDGFKTPQRELRAYAKTALLQPGESERVRFELPLAELSSYHEDVSAWITPQGRHTLSFGASVEDIRCRLEVDVPKAITRNTH